LQNINLFHFDLEDHIGKIINNHLNDIKIFFSILSVNIIIFGQKIFFYSLATDDYSRYYSHEYKMWLTAVSGRWAQDLLNNNIFYGGLHVLPYFHGVIGLFSFTLVGFLTAKYFKQNNTFVITMITLLISATPMFAHNLYFNTNITMWITMLLGVIGFLLAHKPNIFVKILGFILLVIAIGNYQTIVQLLLVMIIFKAIINLLETKYLKEIKPIIFYSFVYIFFIMAAYIASVAVNEFFIHYYHLTTGGRYKIAENVTDLSLYIDRIFKMYHTHVNLYYFRTKFYVLYILMGILSLGGATYSILKTNIKQNVKFIVLLLIVILFISLPIIINLPLLTGNGIPTRAHFTIGWVLAGLYIIQVISLKGIFKTFSSLTALLIIVISTYYIVLFFDAGNRQTSADITRINQIVTRIRTNKSYISEPLKFKIIGKKSFPVIGWKSEQQALNTNWSKYGAFKNFTDFKFTKMSDQDYNEMINYLAKKNIKTNDYPAKNSIFIYEGKVILVLDSKNINRMIKTYNNMKMVIIRHNTYGRDKHKFKEQSFQTNRKPQ